MHLLNNLSITKKLILLSAVSSGAALLFCSAGFVYEDIAVSQRTEIRHLRTQAAMLAFNSTAILTFQDAEAAEQLLRSLDLQPRIVFGCLYDKEGRALASYSRDGAKPRKPLPTASPGETVLTEGGFIELTQDVFDGEERVGMLYLRANTDELQSRIWSLVGLAAIVFFCSMGVSILLSAGLQKTISRPILALSQTAERITRRGDYSVRANTKAGAELGNLCHAFNRMLARIQSSEEALHEANEQLDNRVKQRTAELEKEIAQREATQAALEKSRDAAESANQAKSQFLANMSHEIRTPLNGILGFSEILMKDDQSLDNSERLDYARTINSSGKHLLELINDILDLSKIEAERMKVDHRRCSIQQVINEVLSVLRVQARQKGLSLENERRGDIPTSIVTDPARVRQLLTNIVGNAIKFTATGYVRVVTSFVDDAERPKMKIEVIDTGCGIPGEKFESIFEPFVQVDSSVTRKHGGTGLGLAICRRIARALGGDLTVQSTCGEGSTFTLLIDAGNIEGMPMISEGSAEAVCPHRDRREASTVHLSPIEILLVEDGETNRKLLSLILRRAGANVTTAENGRIAVNLATEMGFDLILMDMQMPEMDGYTATTLLRQQGVSVPIIALTAHAMKGDEEKCVAAGCSGFLTKPIDADLLLRTVRDAAPAPESPAYEPDADDSPLISALPMDDPELREIVGEFVERLDEQLEVMCRAWKDEDLAKLGQLAHWLAGVAGAAGFNELTAPARRLGQAIDESRSDRIDTAMEELRRLADRVTMPIA